jgi:hypothetical protein
LLRSTDLWSLPAGRAKKKKKKKAKPKPAPKPLKPLKPAPAPRPPKPMPAAAASKKRKCGSDDEQDTDDNNAAVAEFTESGRRKRKDTGSKRAPSRAWTADEEALCEEALALHGRDWHECAAHVGTRDHRAITSHVQKYFIKLCLQGKPLPPKVAESGEGYTLSGREPSLVCCTCPHHLLGSNWALLKSTESLHLPSKVVLSSWPKKRGCHQLCKWETLPSGKPLDPNSAAARLYGFKPDTINKTAAEDGDASGSLSAEESAAALEEGVRRLAAAEAEAEERRRKKNQAAKDERGAAMNEKAAAANEKRPAKVSKKEQQEAVGGLR